MKTLSRPFGNDVIYVFSRQDCGKNVEKTGAFLVLLLEADDGGLLLYVGLFQVLPQLGHLRLALLVQLHLPQRQPWLEGGFLCLGKLPDSLLDIDAFFAMRIYYKKHFYGNNICRVVLRYLSSGSPSPE
jgi:hypothetical protein